jgi:hypothetical protein
MLDVCCTTAFSLRWRWAAMPALLRPSAINTSTSSCRVVSELTTPLAAPVIDGTVSATYSPVAEGSPTAGIKTNEDPSAAGLPSRDHHVCGHGTVRSINVSPPISAMQGLPRGVPQRTAPSNPQPVCSQPETWLSHNGSSVKLMTANNAPSAFLPWHCLRRRSGAHNASVYTLIS